MGVSFSRSATRYAPSSLCAIRPIRRRPHCEPQAELDVVPAPPACVPAKRTPYRALRHLGQGAYGEVFEGEHEVSGARVALKRVPLDRGEIPAEALREVACLQALQQGDRVVRLFSVEADNAHVTLVLELLVEDLRAVLRRGPLGGGLQRRYAQQLLAGVAFMHARHVLHRDIKPHNLLLDERGDLKIADFGLARVEGPSMTPEVVTMWYRAPELLLGLKAYGGAIDTWSCGCVIAEMATGKPLFPGDSEVGMLMRIFQALGTPTEESYPGYHALPHASMRFPRWPSTALQVPGMPAALQALVQRLLQHQPEAREAPRKAANDPLFGGKCGGLEEVRPWPLPC